MKGRDRKHSIEGRQDLILVKSSFLKANTQPKPSEIWRFPLWTEGAKRGARLLVCEPLHTQISSWAALSSVMHIYVMEADQRDEDGDAISPIPTF